MRADEHESSAHQPVLLWEAVQALNIQPEGVYVDATYGRGGHTAEILAQLGSSGRLLALDRDPAAASHARRIFVGDARFTFERANFGGIADIVKQHDLSGKIAGVLLDLGVSSPQLDIAERGFSFRDDGPLDMRMDPRNGIDAAEWLAIVTEKDLASALKTLGEERYHRRIARAIVEARQRAPLTTTLQLANVIAAAAPRRERDKHPATRSFQAIRMVINRELEELEAALEQTLDVLATAGRLVVISFHSLEDRIVKRFMRRHAQPPNLPLDLPIPAAQLAGQTRLRIIGRMQRPSAAEIEANPRARSALLRVAERLA